MFTASIVALAAGPFIAYPAFDGRKGPVEAIIDKGPILELIVKCPVGTGIISYSKIERLYCAPSLACFDTLAGARNRTCR